MTAHLAEMLLDLKLHKAPDSLRKKRPFSDDIQAAHDALFKPNRDKWKKMATYRRWLETGQPCVFGRLAAKNERVFICLLEENHVLTMRNGDTDLRDTIQDHRQVWKRYALEGLSSSFLILLLSRSAMEAEPGPSLKEVCRRLLELYMEVDGIQDDTIQAQREYVFLRHPTETGTSKILKFSTLPNVFCAQGDGRWWHDHRTPGGVMVTSNALGHFMYSRTTAAGLDEKERLWALEQAMRTINNAYRGPAKRRSALLQHCPATRLVPLGDGETSPLRSTSDMRQYSPDHYEGFFHTDHLIPSVFFQEARDPEHLELYDNLSFRYIFDSALDAKDHAELMQGVDATWYDVRQSMSRLPDFANPENSSVQSAKLRGRLSHWLDARVKARIET